MAADAQTPNWLGSAGEQLALHVKDQGSGMIDAATGAIADQVPSLGLGILGMQQRLQQFGGQLAIHTSPQGTEIIATVPLTRAPTGQRARGSVREHLELTSIVELVHYAVRHQLIQP
jgi:signal transduction histidine kinase